MSDNKLESMNEHLRSERKKSKEVNGKNKKISKKALALILAALIVIAAPVGILVSKFFKKNKTEETKPTYSTSTKSDTLPEKNELSDLGVELEQPEIKKEEQYQNPTGDVVVEDIVKDEDTGKLYKNEEAKENAGNVGKETIDTKGDKLVVQDDGKVVEKNEGYEIKDENDKVVDSGDLNESKIPNGYAWDSVLEEYVPEKEVGKYVKDDEGNIWEKDRYEEYLKLQKEETKTETQIIPEEEKKEETEVETTLEGIVNPDGTYTIYGITYKDKTTFEYFILDENSEINFGFYNGIVYPISDINEMNKELIK